MVQLKVCNKSLVEDYIRLFQFLMVQLKVNEYLRLNTMLSDFNS